MNLFEVYKHPVFGYQAVKYGFCWPAFFLTVIWAWFKKLWISSILILGTFFTLFLGKAAFAEQSNNVGVLVINCLVIILHIMIGIKGNSWWANDLLTRGFKKLTTVHAETPDAAIGLAAKSKKY